MSEAVLLTSTYLYDLFINSFSSYPIYLKICLLLMLLCIIGIIEIILYITIKRIVRNFKGDLFAIKPRQSCTKRS